MNVVFEGGGIKGLSYIGALRCLEERGLRINSVAGTSVGALIAALVAVGYKSNELEQIIETIDFDAIWPCSTKKGLKKTIDFVKKRYVYDIKPLEDTLTKVLKEKGKTTFGDLKMGNSYRLRIIVTNLKNKDILVVPDDLLLYGINPDTFEISKAVCMSSSIPLVYPPYKVNNYSFVDGGLGDNFPIWLYDKNVIGFRVNKDSKILNLLQKHVFKNTYNHQHENLVYINTTDFKATDFTKGINARKMLYNRGYYHTKIFLDNYFLSGL